MLRVCFLTSVLIFTLRLCNINDNVCVYSTVQSNMSVVYFKDVSRNIVDVSFDRITRIVRRAPPSAPPRPSDIPSSRNKLINRKILMEYNIRFK